MDDICYYPGCSRRICDTVFGLDKAVICETHADSVININTQKNINMY